LIGVLDGWIMVKAEVKNKLAIGKRNEFTIWGYLLGEGFDVFPSLVDDKGIDGIVGHNGRYFEVQKVAKTGTISEALAALQ